MLVSDLFRELLIDAQTLLLKILTVNNTIATENTHRIVEVSGWQNKEALSVLALYLVALPF